MTIGSYLGWTNKKIQIQFLVLNNPVNDLGLGKNACLSVVCLKFCLKVIDTHLHQTAGECHIN